MKDLVVSASCKLLLLLSVLCCCLLLLLQGPRECIAQSIATRIPKETMQKQCACKVLASQLTPGVCHKQSSSVLPATLCAWCAAELQRDLS